MFLYTVKYSIVCLRLCLPELLRISLYIVGAPVEVVVGMKLIPVHLNRSVLVGESCMKTGDERTDSSL